MNTGRWNTRNCRCAWYQADNGLQTHKRSKEKDQKVLELFVKQFFTCGFDFAMRDLKALFLCIK